ncbi:MAG: tetratricopeptide repeat protein [Terriglobia bacterium]|jgi:tetratricopeptide (TPR) repeat protein
MHKLGKRLGVGVGVFLAGAMALFAAQDSGPSGAAKASGEALPAVADHAQAYYHFMLARRYKELAGVYNRTDYIDRAVSEYKQAIAADPESLFLRVELAELYWRVSRVGDAIHEAEDVLKSDPNYPDAHRLLARVYWHMLGESQTEKTNSENLHKAIEHMEALTRLEPSDTDSWQVLGRLYKLNNQDQKAEEAFKKVLNVDPDSKGGLSSLAQLYFEQGDYAGAVELLKKIPEDDLDPSLLAMLGYAYSQKHDFESAVATYEKALAKDPENQELRRSYADALMDMGNTPAARTEFEKILKADPDDGSTYLRLAQLDRQEGRFDQARKELERARTSPQPADTKIQYDMKIQYEQALLEDAAGNQDKAIELLQGLVKSSEQAGGQYTPGEANNRAIFLERLGLIYRTQRKYQPALQAFQQIVALGKAQAPRGEELIVDTMRLTHQLPKALDEVNSAVQKFPAERSLRILRAYVVGEMGRVGEAVNQLQGLMNNTPADRELYLSVAQVYSQAKQFAEAEQAVNKALGYSSKPEEQEYSRFMLASIYERQKKYDLAEEQFKKVLAVDPLNASAANYLGYMLADRGVRLEESVKYIQKALELEPNNGAYLDSLGWAYYKMNRCDLAEPPLEQAARLMSDDPTIHEHLGHLYLQMGKETLAEQEWERALKDWPQAASTDFDADQAAKLQRELEELKLRLAKQRSVQK